jgi:hypothetical protein
MQESLLPTCGVRLGMRKHLQAARVSRDLYQKGWGDCYFIAEQPAPAPHVAHPAARQGHDQAGREHLKKIQKLEY